ncbi:MAG: SusC/RagA family TonB-linked outer membrane protein [Saprospiraceae bacterium]|nr:SusC/RagA family TonB-linked outer membrane protein [Saprospiraceae bacterium]
MLLSVQFAFAQRTLTGKITDAETNEPLIGATISATGTAVGTSTNATGEFSLNVPNGVSTLSISYTGFEKQDVSIEGLNNIQVSLRPNALLNEVIVTGYATEKKRDLLGAVAVLDMNDVKDAANPNVLQSMQGRVAGVSVDLSGDPGQGVSVRVRGTSTLGKLTDPLYIVDGVPIQSFVSNENNSTVPQTWDLSWLNPNDIASIQVLKDASSASIYGSRASNGVVIITTKQPGKQKARVDFNVRTSIEKWNDFDDLTNNRERAIVEWQGAVNDGTNPDNTGIYTYKWHLDPSLGSGIQGNGVPVLDEIIYPEWLDEDDQLRPSGHAASKYGGNIEEGTDYWKEISRMGSIQNYDLSFSQGNERGGIQFGANYLDQRGVIINSNFKRMGLRMNSNFKFWDGKVTIGENMTVSRGQRLWLDNGFGGTPEQAPYRYKSILPVRTEDGRFSGPPGGGFSDRDNPVALSEDNKDDRTKNVKIFGNVYAELQLMKNLTFRSSFGGDYDNIFSKDIFRTYSRGFLANTTAELNLRQTHQTNWVFNNTLMYTNTFGGHSLTALAGTEAIKNTVNIFSASGKSFAQETVDYFQLGAASGERTSSGLSTGFSLFSYFGKLNYDYSSKYLASVTVRRDGSSRFGTQNRFALFPAASLGWRVSEEGFLRNSKFISNLKIRAAWGQTGNQDILNDARFGLYQAVYAPSSNILPWDGGCAQTPCPDAATSYDIGNNDSGILPSGFLATQTGNDLLRWETTTEANFGVDFGILNDKLSGTLEVFKRETEDILVKPKQIGAFGDGASQWVNGASMETKGWELSLNYTPPARGDWRYSVGTVFSHYQSIITGLPENLLASYAGNVEKNIIGQAPNALFGYHTDGIFQNQAEVDAHANQVGKRIGALRYVDLNKDGDINALDQEYGAANGVPKVEFGFNLELQWKNLDFSLFTWGAMGRKVTPDVYRMELGSLDNGENGGVAQLDAWSPTNTGSYIPAASNSNRPYGFSLDYNVRNGNYLSFRQAMLGYTFPKAKLGSHVSNLRIYLSGENLGWIVDRKGSNQYPQTGWSVESRLAGIYPKAQRFSFGISAGF